MFSSARRTYPSSARWSSIRSHATYVLASAVCSRSSASHGFAVSERAVRSRTGPRARTYEENDAYGVYAWW